MTETQKDAVVDCLKKMKRYKIDKAAFIDIDEEGRKDLANIEELRRRIREKEDRKRKRIYEAVDHS